MYIENSDNIIQDLSFKFAVRVVKFYRYLVDEKREYVLSKQILRSGTSIGANVRESLHGQSEADFVNKLQIALKEADETEYWLELFHATNLISDEEFSSLSSDVKQLIGTLVKIIKSKKGIQ
ncbi:MAG: four helix bundle protein [Prevotella sp.]|nr:four helix bundle protein [Prevotella sp.]MBR5656819.1 four helix bundle protein [Prevotella sp.]